MRRLALGLAVAMVTATACGGRSGGGASTAVFVPERAATAGDRLLAKVPAGAQVLVEIDLARLRANPVVGPTITEMFAAGLDVPGAGAGAAPGAVGALAAAPLADARFVILAAYRVGTASATTLTIVDGGVRPDAALDLGDGVWALAPEGDAPALIATAGGGASVRGDDALMAVRASVMPDAADGASLRAAARLDEVGRAALATALGLPAAPAVVSAWGDVADDLAVRVALSDGAVVASARTPTWLSPLKRLIERAATADAIRALGLAPSIAGTEIERVGAGFQVTLVIGPARLARAVERLRAHRGAPPS